MSKKHMTSGKTAFACVKQILAVRQSAAAMIIGALFFQSILFVLPGAAQTLRRGGDPRDGATAVAGVDTPISLTMFGTAATENFDTLATTGTSATTPAGWGFVESGANANTTYTAGTGSSNSGDTYSLGSTSSTERAFGGLRSGSLISTIGAAYTNNTGGTINSLAVSYTGEEWRLGTAGRTDQIDFQYSTDATSLTTGTWTDVNVLDFVTPATGGTVGLRDGNADANRTAISSTIFGLSISPGTTFYIRWTDLDATGADDALAVDDFSLTAIGGTSGTPTPTPTVTPTPTPTPTVTPTPTPTPTAGDSRSLYLFRRTGRTPL